MRVIEGRTFRYIQKYPWRRTIRNIEFSNCDFYGCKIFFEKYLFLRARIVNVRTVNCETYGHIELNSTILEDVLVDHIQMHGGKISCCGCSFRHLKLVGKIDEIDIYSPDQYGRARYDTVKNRFYDGVDWAIDIAQAKYLQVSTIAGVPTKLIRRDEETQVIVRRDKVLDERFRKMPIEDRFTNALSSFLRNEEAEMILIAPSRNHNFKSYLKDFELLRSEGIVE